MRGVVIHYHLFKNAGTTVDSLLERSFGPAWRPLERAPNTRFVSADDFLRLAIRDPAVQAISSHSARLPTPSDPQIVFHPVVFLRHPIDRIRSVYEFERRVGASAGKTAASIASVSSRSAAGESVGEPAPQRRHG